MKTSNSCSGGVSWFYRKILQRPAQFDHCCKIHDQAYDSGRRYRDKINADLDFYHCVRDAQRPVKAYFFLAAVLLFGNFNWFKPRLLKRWRNLTKGKSVLWFVLTAAMVVILSMAIGIAVGVKNL